MNATKLALVVLAAACTFVTARAEDDTGAMDTIVVTAKRQSPIDSDAAHAAEKRSAALDFDELTLTPPRFENPGTGTDSRKLKLVLATDNPEKT
jgi:hypothetical protein